MSDDGRGSDQNIDDLLAEDAFNAQMQEGLLDRLDSFSPDYDKDLEKRLKNRPVSSREKGILDYLTANNISPRGNHRISPTFLTSTGGKLDYSMMGNDHTEAFGRSLPYHNANQVTPNSASDSLTRVEEDVHSLQKSILGFDKPLSNKSRKNKRALKKELKNAGFTPEEYDRKVRDNYSLSNIDGSKSVLEFEAKMIATKMMLMEQGILDSADEVVTKEKLDEIIAWKRNQFDWDNADQDRKKGKMEDYTTILYAHDSPKMRELLLKTFNDL